MMDTDILFTGFYGQLNTGDDAFVEVASWGSRLYWGIDNVRFLAKRNNLPSTDRPLKGYPITFPKTYKYQDSFLLSNSRYLISAGGSTIHGKLSKSGIKYKALQKKLNGDNIKVGGIGVSIGPFKNSEDERSVVHYLKNIDFLALRDEKSFQFANSLNLPYKPINAFDLAALLPEVYQKQVGNANHIKNTRPTIGVSVCPVESIVGGNIQDEVKRNSKMISLLKEIEANLDVNFKFYIINGNKNIGDLDLTKATIAAVAPKYYQIEDYTKKTEQVWTSISNCDFVLSTRLHAAIFACFAEVPFMLVEYHRKCSDFLDNIGYRHEYRLGDADFETKCKAQEIIDVLSGCANFIKPDRILEMIERAKHNFTQIQL